MPPTRRAYLQRRLRQVDSHLRRSEEHLASFWVTIKPQHPELEPELLGIIAEIDGLRGRILNYYRGSVAGSERGLHEPGELGAILAEAEPVPDPPPTW